MKPRPPRIRLRSLPILATVFSTFAPLSSVSALEWDRTKSGTRNFYDAANWIGGVAPAHPESGQIKFDTAGIAVAAELLLTEGRTEQVLRGGLWFHITSQVPGGNTIDLKGHRLILEGGVLQFSVAGGGTTAKSAAMFENGTVQVGTSMAVASIQVGSNIAENNSAQLAMQFKSGSTLDTFNTQSITVAAEKEGQSKNLLLDLSGAELKSGNRLQTLAVTEDIVIGAHYRANLTDGRNVYGAIKLGAVSMVEVQRDLIIAHRAVGANGSGTALTSGMLEVAYNAAPITLSVGRSLRIGTGDRTTGSIVSAANQQWDVAVGAETAEAGERGDIHIGYKDRVGSNSPQLGTEGSFVSGGGSFNAYISELAVGKNALEVGTATGVLDFSKSELGRLEVTEAAMIGQGTGAVGRLLLKGGSASSEDLIVGESTASGRSVLRLDGTLWVVTGEVRIGAVGDISIFGDLSTGGLDILSGALNSLLVAEGGVIDISFDYASDGGVLWGLRMAGDCTMFLEGLTDTGRLSASGLYGDQATIYYDGTHTYFGLVAIPEPSMLMLTTGFGLAMLCIRRIRR